MNYEIGVDIGGTFTDVVCRAEDGTSLSAKVMSTRADPSVAVGRALDHIEQQWGIPAPDITQFLHGTTVATNAIIEKTGAKLGVLATLGFADALEIGRQWRGSRELFYASIMAPQTPIFLAPARLRREVSERLDASGEVIVPLDEEGVRQTLRDFDAEGIRAVAICYLFSFRNPVHELRTREIAAAEFPHMQLSLSSEVDPYFREYERTVATCFDAYIRPVIATYMSRIEAQLERKGIPANLKVMQSRGGLASSLAARERPVRLFVSGPAAGVTGASAVGASVGIGNVITIDIGGTSCDIALIRDGQPEIKRESVIDGYNMRVPSVDVNAIGAGGGSIAWLDTAGGIRVGPKSAGSDPGPACYGKGGTSPTVTDASLILGYIDPGYFAGGTISLSPELAEEAIRREIAEPLGLSVTDAALGIHRVVNAQMAEAIRLVSVRRGYDARDFSLMPFGGGGAVHAAPLARELSIPSIAVPLRPGVLCAEGLLVAQMQTEYSAGFSANLDEADEAVLHRVLAEATTASAEEMRRETDGRSPTRTTYCFDMCYVGQSYQVQVRIRADAGGGPSISRLRTAFEEEHTRIYGYSAGTRIWIVNIRCIQECPSSTARAVPTYEPNGQAALKTTRMVRWLETTAAVETPIYDRMSLPPGTAIQGPAILEQDDTTVLVEPGWTASIDRTGVVLMSHTQPAA